MRRQHVIAGTLILLAGSRPSPCTVLLPTPGGTPAQARQIRPAVFFPPLPPVPIPPDVVLLEDFQKLGKQILFDDTLSDPRATPAATAMPRRRA